MFRAVLFGLLALASASGVAAQPATESVLVISRDEVMTKTQAARQLSEAEARLTDELQSSIDLVKAGLAAEEQELTRLRSTLPREEFDARVQSFDQRVRRERQRTQRRVAALQNAFRRARAGLADAMVPILVAISRQRGARLVLDRDQILVAHPSIDVTAEVIQRMDTELPLPQLPSLADLEGPDDPDAPDEPETTTPSEPNAGAE